MILHRWFATAMLRPEEEVPQEVATRLPRWAEVELEDERPVVAVWRDRSGGRRVIWYGHDDPASVAHEHRARHGDEPYWLLRFEPDANGRRAALLSVCDGPHVIRRLRWTFDVAGMPLTETEVSDDAASYHRTYQCTEDGWIESVRERTGARGTFVDVDPPVTTPIPELTAEPYPCGAFVMGRAVRIVEALSWNAAQGRLRGMQQIDGAWRSVLVTFARIGRAWSAREHAVLSVELPGVAPMTAEGWLEHPRVLGRPFHAIAELEPDATVTVDEHVRSRGPLSLRTSSALVAQLADMALAARARGGEIGGFRPELVYVRPDVDDVQLAAVLHRGPTLLAAARVGESILIPPAFPAAFDAPDDLAGLCQLLWYLTSAGHPFLAPGDVRWERGWTRLRSQQRRPQAWAGPPALAAVFDRFLFAADRADRSVDELGAALRAVAP